MRNTINLNRHAENQATHSAGSWLHAFSSLGRYVRRYPGQALLACLSLQAAVTRAATAFTTPLALSSLDGSNGFVIEGAAVIDANGYSVSGAGDVNGDGTADLLIGAPLVNPNGMNNAGASYVVFGAPSVGAGGTLALSNLNGANGFVIEGISAEARTGYSVSGAGDVNGDGTADLLIGAPFTNPNGINYAGASYVVFGGPTVGAGGTLALSSLNGANGFVIKGVAAGDNTGDKSGLSVSDAGDVNGDGAADLLIGAPLADSNGMNDAGASYVVFGGPSVGAGGRLELSSLNGANGFVIEGVAAFDQSGYSVSGAGDVNGDGTADLLIGAPYGMGAAGASYVVFGGPTVGAGGRLELSSLNGANGFVIEGVAAFDQSGYSVSGAGDVNGDGTADLLIGARYATNPNGDSSGASYVVFGGPTVGAGGTLPLSSLDGTNGFVIEGVAANDQSGYSVSGAGDVNGDGTADLLIGAPFTTNPNGINYAGTSYVVFGGPTVGAEGTLALSSLNGANGFVIKGVAAGDQSGWSVSDAGDVNGDGVADLLIGAPFTDPNGRNNAGGSYVVFGMSPSPTASLSASAPATPSATVSRSMSGSVTPSPTTSVSASASATPSATVSRSMSGSVTPSPTTSLSASASATPSATVSRSMSDSVTPSPTTSVSASASATPSATVSRSMSDSVTPSPTTSLSASASVTPSATASKGVGTETGMGMSMGMNTEAEMSMEDSAAEMGMEDSAAEMGMGIATEAQRKPQSATSTTAAVASSGAAILLLSCLAKKRHENRRALQQTASTAGLFAKADKPFSEKTDNSSFESPDLVSGVQCTRL